MTAVGEQALKPGTSEGGEKPFQLVEYYSVTSLMIILLFAMLIAWTVSTRSTSEAIAKQEQFALLLAESLNHQVMNRFVVTALREYGGINVGQPEQFKLLDAVVRNSIPMVGEGKSLFNVLKVNILDLDGNIIYSTQPEYIGRIGDEGPGFRIAASGGSKSIIEPGLDAIMMGAGPQRTMKMSVPLRDQRRRTAELGPPRAVFEIEMDVSADFRDVWHNQLLIMAALLAMMAVLFVILRTIVLRGQRVMARQAEERAQLIEQVNQSARLASLGRMIAGVAHEIRNPLGIIRSTAELLGGNANQTAKPLAGVIVEESNRLNQIVTEFLDFARPQRASLEPILIEDVLERNLSVLQPELTRLGIALEREYNQGGVVVRADSDLLYRAFLNIFNNAIQVMDDGGILRVSTGVERHDGSRMGVVTVEDTGPGFEPEILDKIQDPFFTTREKGTGLGLSIVGNIVNSHEGKLVFERGENGGAIVKMILPLA